MYTWMRGRPKRYLRKPSFVMRKERRMVRKVPRIRITGKVLTQKNIIFNTDNRCVSELTTHFISRILQPFTLLY